MSTPQRALMLTLHQHVALHLIWSFLRAISFFCPARPHLYFTLNSRAIAVKCADTGARKGEGLCKESF